MRLARSQSLLDVVGASTAEDNDVEERVGAETVRTVDGYTRGLTGGVQTLNNLVVAILFMATISISSGCVVQSSTHLVGSENLTGVLGGNTTHYEIG